MSKADLLMEMPSSLEAQKAVKAAVKEYVDTMIRIDGEKELQKSGFSPNAAK